MKINNFEHSLLKSVVLHLLPGILIGICYFALVPAVKSSGFPPVMALSLAALLILIPFELGFLLHRKRVEGKPFLEGVVRYTKPLKTWQYFVFVFLIVILSGLAFKAFAFTTDFLMPLFRWIPSGSFLDMGLDGEYSKSKLIITYGSFLILLVLVSPAVEEFYFRGYLLPRMPSKMKGWTEIIHSALFALYHTWTPWLFITRTLGVLPLACFVKRKENVYIGIISHCLINSIDFIIGLVFIMNL
ncbi:MAG TPA: CPBP family intramembrane metalloprotease [Bacteroidetes bacterium]|nr:CPBP family intramembrane metalloprotease [Bacteroidota bacterium]